MSKYILKGFTFLKTIDVFLGLIFGTKWVLPLDIIIIYQFHELARRLILQINNLVKTAARLI